MPPLGGKNAFPPLGEKISTVTGKFMIIESAEESSAEVSSADEKPKTLADISAFLIEKTIQCYCGEVESIKKTRDGKILVLTKNAKSAKNLQKLENLGEEKVKVSEHSTLNKCRVVVVCRDVIGDDEKTIAENLAPQGVTKVKRIMKKVNGKLVKTAALEITMNTPNEPTSLKIAYTRVPTRPYYPRPRRCYKCLKFGHISVSCEANQLCWRCAEEDHGKDVICENPIKCINCDNGSHTSTSNKCPKYVKEMAVIRIKVDKNISYEEARKEVNGKHTTNYADAIKKGLEEKFQTELKKRDDQMKNLADLLEASMKREAEATKLVEKFQEQINKLENKIEKLHNTITKEKEARKMAETEYDTLMAHCTAKKEKSSKQKHYRNQIQTNESAEQSPSRKKTCRKEPNAIEIDISPLELNRPNDKAADNQDDSEMDCIALPSSDSDSHLDQ